jgi:phage shock protein A
MYGSIGWRSARSLDKDGIMILGTLWRTIRAQLNKLANFFWEADPIAAMQLEYDRAVAQLREGRLGLAEFRAFIERVGRQVARNQANVTRLEATVKTYLKAGDRESAGRFVLELQRARRELAENQAQLRLHEQAYDNNLLKIKHAGGKLTEIRNKIARYDADLKMSAAEAEMASLAQDFHVDVTTDFGQLESAVQDKIDLNRAKVRVAVDLSGEGVAEIRQESAAQDQLGEDALREFEKQMGQEGHATPSTTTGLTRARLTERS